MDIKGQLHSAGPTSFDRLGDDGQKPEWYFLFIYAMLCSMPNRFGGLVMPRFQVSCTHLTWTFLDRLVPIIFSNNF